MLGLYGGATGLVIELAARKAIEAFSKKSTDSAQTSAQLSDEAQKAELQSLVFQSQAKVQQELAIARRILAAEEVEIEEFYDGSASAELVVKASTEKVSLGLNGEGRKITKRVIKFKGFNNQVEHILQEIDKSTSEIIDTQQQ